MSVYICEKLHQKLLMKTYHNIVEIISLPQLVVATKSIGNVTVYGSLVRNQGVAYFRITQRNVVAAQSLMLQIYMFTGDLIVQILIKHL